MSIKQLIFISVCFIFTFNTAFSQFNSAGTDYSLAGTETWIQDNAADSLKMINSFVCIAGLTEHGEHLLMNLNAV